MDLFQKCQDFIGAKVAREEGYYPYYREIDSPQEPVVTMDGHKVIMLGSNNYLGLTNHPEVKTAAIRAIVAEGESSFEIIWMSEMWRELFWIWHC